MTTLETPPDPYPFTIGSWVHENPAIMQVFYLLDGERLKHMKKELEDEVHYITSEEEVYKPYYYPTRMYWCGHSGVSLINKLYPAMFPLAHTNENGLPAQLKHLFLLLPNSCKVSALVQINRIWQFLWSDHSIALHPSTYTNFCRDKMFKVKDSPLFVRPIAIDIENIRTQHRLDKGLLRPKHISRSTIMNGVKFCWEDYMGNNPVPAPTGGIMSHKDRATFVLCQLMVGSRFKGIAEDNEILAVFPDGVLLEGLSKCKDKTKKVTRPVNVSLAAPVAKSDTERMEIFYTMMLKCRKIYKDISAEREDESREEIVATQNLMRKEIRRYIQQAFPGMLVKGEATHLLRKIYLQLAFETYGKGMKETGFASRVFAHEGYNASLHYTSVIIT